MSKTLRGAPIVGYFKKDKEDFGDHGERMTLDDEGIHFECLTRPYGFIAPDAKVWFKKFQEYDEKGREVEREYLMTTGYLWTGQYEECADVINSGRPHSMEITDVDGHWTQKDNGDMDFFIINDATFSKLCILGNNVEPCFEGSSVTAPSISKSFDLDDTFKNTLFSMIQDLKNLVQGGYSMDDINETIVEEEVLEPVADEEIVEVEQPVEEPIPAEEPVV